MTGRDDLQAFGHCVGSRLAADGDPGRSLQGIRTAVCAQFPMPHPSTSVFNRRCEVPALHTAGAFRALGGGGLAPDIRRSVPDELLDLGMRTLPM